jgi:methionyl-tRNA synthetase
MDEHGEKIAKTAQGRGQQPQELVDDIAVEFQDLWKLLRIENGHFARTTSDKHRPIVEEMWQRCLDNGDIYKKEYRGWYCVGCEAYLDPDEMSEDHVCNIHQKPAEDRTEENYFFRLSKYWDKVREHIEQNEDFIIGGRRNEVLNWLNDDNKRDFSISRASTKWGLPVPGDDSQVIYVWFDALLGYLSSLLRPEDPANLETVLKRGWPADVHIIGKDIMRFHAIYWPAMLMSAGLPLPKHICSHGFLTKDGQKMGKSLGNVVEPVPLVENFGADAVRFYFSACLAFGDDGDFNYEVFIKRVNTFLANELGNLTHRILTLSRKNGAEVPVSPSEMYDELPMDHPIRKATLEAVEIVAGHYERVDLPKAADAALQIASVGNAVITEVAPWVKLKGSDEDKRIALREMMVLAEAVRICAVLLAPLVPDLSMRILTEFGVAPAGGVRELHWKDTAWTWDALPGLAKGKKPKPAFMRIDVEPWKGK